jgi:hypothetical protein
MSKNQFINFNFNHPIPSILNNLSRSFLIFLSKINLIIQQLLEIISYFNHRVVIFKTLKNEK